MIPENKHHFMESDCESACGILQDRPEPLEVHRSGQRLQQIALGRYLLQAILGFPNAWLLRHHDLQCC